MNVRVMTGMRKNIQEVKMVHVVPREIGSIVEWEVTNEEFVVRCDDTVKLEVAFPPSSDRR